MSKMINLNLVLILEPHIDILKLIEEAVLGGVTCVQWRDKFYNDRDFYEQALLIKKLCDRLNVSLIINDRVDIALAVGADGVHLGKSDFPYEAARKILPENMIIGGTAETLEDVIEAEKYDLGYLSIVPVFTSSNKASVGEPWGLEGLKKARALSRHRLLATGGITVENARIIRDIGIDGLAVASHICREASHCEAARAFC